MTTAVVIAVWVAVVVGTLRWVHWAAEHRDHTDHIHNQNHQVPRPPKSRPAQQGWGTRHQGAYPMTVTSTHGHTYRDAAAMTAAGINPADTQPREHAVPCAVCHTDTWNVGGRCDDHVYPLTKVDFDSFETLFAVMGDVDILHLVATLNAQLHQRGAGYRFRLVTADPT